MIAMGSFQCSSSWGFPEVKRFRYESLRNYSGFVFEFDRSDRRIRVESRKIRDPRIRNFSWTFDANEDDLEQVDRLVSIGRVGEINSEKKSYSTGSFWSSEVAFDGKEHMCSSSTDYPFSVLEMEDGLFALSDRLADGIKADIRIADSMCLEFLSEHRTLIRIDADKRGGIRLEIGKGSDVERRSMEYDDSFIRSVLDTMEKSQINGPRHIIDGKDECFSGRIMFGFGKDSFRIDLTGDDSRIWKKCVEEIFSIIDEL